MAHLPIIARLEPRETVDADAEAAVGELAAAVHDHPAKGVGRLDAAPAAAERGADIEPGPVIGRRNARRRHRGCGSAGVAIDPIKFVVHRGAGVVIHERHPVDAKFGRFAEADIQIFKLGGHVLGDAVFEPEIQRPAGAAHAAAHRADAGNERAAGQPAERRPDRDIRKKPVERIADAGAKRAEPRELGRVRKARRRLAAGDRGPQQIAVQAPDPRARLVAQSKVCAEQPAANAKILGVDGQVGKLMARDPDRAARHGADIDATPIVQRSRNGSEARRSRGVRSEVGGACCTTCGTNAEKRQGRHAAGRRPFHAQPAIAYFWLLWQITYTSAANCGARATIQINPSGRRSACPIECVNLRQERAGPANPPP
jgi:hypothetical protein